MIKYNEKSTAIIKRMEGVPGKKKDPTICHTHKPTAPTENLQLPRKGPRDSLQLPQAHSSAFCIPETRLFCYRERHFTSLKGTKDVDTSRRHGKATGASSLPASASPSR
jgi:hypothetical protein